MKLKITKHKWGWVDLYRNELQIGGTYMSVQPPEKLADKTWWAWQCTKCGYVWYDSLHWKKNYNASTTAPPPRVDGCIHFIPTEFFYVSHEFVPFYIFHDITGVNELQERLGGVASFNEELKYVRPTKTGATTRVTKKNIESKYGRFMAVRFDKLGGVEIVTDNYVLILSEGSCGGGEWLQEIQRTPKWMTE